MPFVDQRNHGVGRLGIELGAGGAIQASHVAGVLNGGHLHPQADAQVRDAALASELSGQDLALHTALAETTGHQNGIKGGQLLYVARRQRFRVDVLDPYAGLVVDARVSQGLVE